LAQRLAVHRDDRIMTLASIGFGLIMFGVITHAAASAIQDKIDISVYFNTNTSEDEILNIQQSLEGSRRWRA